MAAQLYPLVFKPGIKRDGTPFQGEYCTDGQWVRWQRGVIRKMGGMNALNEPFVPTTAVRNYFNVLLLPSPTNTGLIYVYLMNGLGITYRVMSSAMISQGNPVQLSFLTEYTLWQSQVIIKNTYKKVNLVDVVDTSTSVIVFLGCQTAININAQSASVLSVIKVGEIVKFAGINQNNLTDIVASGADGGMCWSAPYLFFYGSNGVVKYSNSIDPFNPIKYTTITIASDKVIFGAPIRGGSASPCILFWTLSSVVRIANIASLKEDPQFRIDTVSQSSSIISSRSVVEYDSVYYWVGTDRFFTYNGLVSELANPMNLNYFFDSIDMARRQQVFGVKNAKYGEIWWFYPVTGVAGSNSRAIIYNVRENSWYDTAISRDCGMLLESNGTMYTFGQQLQLPDPTKRYLWAHEQGVNQVNVTPGIAVDQQNIPIRAEFTTPIFSWASFNPLKQPTGTDRWTYLQRFEPNFIMGLPPTPDTKIQKMILVVNTRKYGNFTKDNAPYDQNNSPITRSDPPIEFDGNTGKIDIMIQGRQMNFTFSSLDFFEMGYCFMLLGIGDAQ